MSIARVLCFVAFVIASVSCQDTSSNPIDVSTPRELSLTASSTTGIAPCDILLTGTFNAFSDTTRIHVPEMFVFGGPGMTVVRYTLLDTSVAAKRTYTYSQHFVSEGTYSMFMILQTTTKDVFSDTLVVTIR
jgi:hypothetical protein